MMPSLSLKVVSVHESTWIGGLSPSSSIFTKLSARLELVLQTCKADCLLVIDAPPGSECSEAF